MADIVYQSGPLSWEPRGSSGAGMSSANLGLVDWGAVNSALMLRDRMDRTQEANRAAALRWEGQQEYEALINAGTPPEDALRKTAHKLYFGHPAGLATALRSTMKRPEAVPQAKYFHVGDALYRVDPTGQVTPLIQPPNVAPEVSESHKLALNKAALDMQQKEARLMEDVEGRAESPEHKAVTNFIATVFNSYPIGANKAAGRPVEAAAVPSAGPLNATALSGALPGAPAAPFANMPFGQTPAAAPDMAIPTVTTKAEFDALPSGTTYIGKDGRRFKKP